MEQRLHHLTEFQILTIAYIKQVKLTSILCTMQFNQFTRVIANIYVNNKVISNTGV